jgi:hypothetical protein
MGVRIVRRRLVAALGFFAMAETVVLGVGLGYAVLAERVCDGSVVCATPQPEMVNPPTTPHGLLPQPVWPNSTLFLGFENYGPRE